MNALDDLLPPPSTADDGGELLTQLVAAVDFLRRGASPGLTVWDAMEQALRIFGNFEADWLDPDPLLRAIRVSTSIVGHLTTAEVITAAIREWLSAMSSIYNEGIPWRERPLLLLPVLGREATTFSDND
jgi:hypothetical protein